ncbi:uncharacterized protein LOC117586362 [Drosophila guanche]|uniref:Uncharacterized protein n=1 Tax=Drosophila guanche TaxID=7266 RepID=A0A3B0JVX3_DROGU|nr:uncharacterized protein LOC117586362 [Drosophila guanche]SPP84592.1 Hypothetical predicted protein [Drosophila guanche]
MFKSKSFDLVSEEKTRRAERLYQPRRLRWLKYIVLPAVFGFVLLLILCNVDFSYDEDADKVLGADSGSALPSAAGRPWWRFIEEEGLTVINELEQLYSENECPSESVLYVSGYKFPNGSLDGDFLVGSFRLQSMEIVDSVLRRIEDGTFDRSQQHGLVTLQLRGTQLQSLTAAAFRGLQKLQNFTLINEEESFMAEGFLAPLASTLLSARIQQRYSDSVSYSVQDFFGVENYTLLKSLDLSGTNLGRLLSWDSFARLPALERLILVDCGFGQVVWNSPPRSLRNLDLSGNPLDTISGNLPTGIELEQTGTTPMIGWQDEPDMGSTPVETTVQAIQAFAPVYRTTTDATTTTTPETSTLLITSTTPAAPLDCWEELCEILSCTDHEGRTNETPVPYNASLQFRDLSNAEVQVRLSHLGSSQWRLVYFATASWSGYVEQESAEESAGHEGDLVVVVSHLDCGTPFVFCVMMAGQNVTSPLNCRAHRTLKCLAYPGASWFAANSGLVIGLGIAGILIGVALGMLIVYVTLRLQPKWLKGSRRLVRPKKDSNTMFLMPRGCEQEEYGYQGNPTAKNDSYDYVAYHRHLEQANSNLYQTESNKYICPPRERAPSVPPSSEAAAKRNYIYESLELYEELPLFPLSI